MAKYDWNPWKLVYGELEDGLEGLAEDRRGGMRAESSGRRPAANVVESAAAFVIEVELPGVRREDVFLEAAGRELAVGGEVRREKDAEGSVYHVVERGFGRFLRRFTLPPGLDVQRASAVFADGLLVVTVPKRSAGGPRRITIDVSE